MNSNGRPSLLVVDDDERFVEATSALARTRDFRSSAATSLADARRALRGERFDLVLLDLQLPDGSGFDLVNAAGARGSSVAVVTGDASLASAAQAVRLPISDYLVKPLDRGRFGALLAQTKTCWTRRQASAARCGDFVGESPAMSEVYRQIRRAGPSHANVLIVGASGTGKELAARALHDQSGRTGPFVAVNCGAVNADLLASQLFGHERGSFTGAVRQHKGYFEQAQGGTVFLDEITEMPLSLQAHLLRVLETRALTRVGSSGEQTLDIRILAATNRNPVEAVADGGLRKDLYYRLAEFTLALPRLCERPADVPLLAQSILDQLNERYGQNKVFSAQTLERLVEYDWPGNVRELRNRIHQAYILSSGDDVPFDDLPGASGFDATAGTVSFAVGTRLDVVEREMLLRTLALFDGDKVRTARALGVSVKTIYNHLARNPPAESAGNAA